MRASRCDNDAVTGAAQDRRILLAAASLRAFSTGAIAVLVAAYLADLGFAGHEVELVVAVGLAGNALALFVATLLGDRIDHKRLLVALALAWAFGGAWLCFAHGTTAIAGAFFVGMVNGMGRDRGAALALEQAALPATTDERGRTSAFAWYNALQDGGHALGALAAGAPLVVAHALHTQPRSSYTAGIGVYATLGLAAALLDARRAERPAPATRPPPLSPETRRVLVRISSLFAIDSLGGGVLTTALVSYFFFERFGASPSVVALLFFGARVANALSHFGAAALARRIGLVKTMVFTHMPSSALLVTVAYAPSFGAAALLFLLREGLVEMDVPTRQSYVMALVAPHERGRASAITNLVRMTAWPISALLGALATRHAPLMVLLVAGAALKVLYDILLYFAFRRLRPPEER
jgi:MFS family permease